MKLFLKLSITIMTLGAIGCSSDSSTEQWRQDRAQLIGEWEGTATFLKTDEDGNETMGEKEVEIEFLSESRLSLKVNQFFNDIYTWIYQPDPEYISIISEGTITVVGVPTYFEVIKNNTNSQQWTTEYFNYEQKDSVTFIRVQTEETWNLIRK